MDLPGNWTLNEPAAPTALEAAEATLGLPLPEDLRNFYSDADGGEAWFEEHHDEPGFFLQVLSLSDTLGMVEVMSEFDGWSDLIPFGTDGSRETFCLSRQNDHIYLVDVT
jgi:cell wall assembly regulator SMI1